MLTSLGGTVIVALFALVAVNGCSDDGSPGQAAPLENQCEASGTLYASVGQDSADGDLYRIDLCPFHVDLLQEAVISSVSAAGDYVVVSDASETLGDAIRQWNGTRLQAIPELGDELAFLPSVNTEGIVAYSTISSANDRSGYAIRTVDLNGGPPTVVEQDDEILTGAQWTPEGELTYLRLPVRDYPAPQSLELEVVTRAKSGERRSAMHTLWFPLAVVPGPSGALALRAPTDDNPDVLFADGRSATFGEGWRAITWSPDGARVLAARGSEIGIAQAPTFRVKRIGEIEQGALLSAAWTESPGGR